MSKVLIITAPSGSGKTTLVHHLLKVFPQLEFSISATTRQPRAGEVDDKDYHFITVEEFKARIAKDKFVEYEEVYPGSYYGTQHSELNKIWSHNHIVVFDVDVKGALNLKKKFRENALSIFIKPPSVEALRHRLTGRGSEEPDKIELRVNKSVEELKYEPEFDVTIVNDTLDHAKLEIEKAVTSFIASA